METRFKVGDIVRCSKTFGTIGNKFASLGMDGIGYIAVNKITGITKPNCYVTEECDFVIHADSIYHCLGNIDDYINRLAESRGIIRVIERSVNEIPF